MDTTDKIMGTLAALTLAFVLYICIGEYISDHQANKTLRHNLDWHDNVKVSKVIHSGLDVTRSNKGQTSFYPTFILEDGTILTEEQFDSNANISFIKEGSIIEYSTILNKRPFDSFNQTMAHVNSL